MIIGSPEGTQNEQCNELLVLKHLMHLKCNTIYPTTSTTTTP